MERIIAGRFPSKGIADTVAALMKQYIDTADICIFHNNAPGQHDAIAGGWRYIGRSWSRRRVIETLHTEGAKDIEQADGAWHDGDWVDFDPVAAPRLVQPMSNASH